MKTCDVAVVGAGPAGSAAARTLARNGLRVALLEREGLPRYKTCGGGVVWRASRLTGLDLSPVVERVCRRASLHLHDIDRRFTVQRDVPLVSMTMRDRLDMLLVEAAVAAGAELLAPCRVQSLTPRGAGLLLGTEQGPLVADFVVAADGATGDVPRLAGWTDGRRTIPALEYEVPVDDTTLKRYAAEPRFDVGTIPYGYAWVFPKAEHLSVGVLSVRRGARDLHAQVARYLSIAGITPVAEPKRHGYVIPVRRRPGPLVRGGVIAVGDAAGFADPLTAEGISFALESGRLAGEVLSRGMSDDVQVAAAYHAELERDVLPQLRAARWLADLLYGWPSVRSLVFRRYGQLIAEKIADAFVGGGPGYRHIPRRVLRRVTAAARSPRGSP